MRGGGYGVFEINEASTEIRGLHKLHCEADTHTEVFSLHKYIMIGKV